LAAEAGLRAKQYQLVLNKDLKARGGEIEIPVLDDVVDPPPDPPPSGIIVPGPEHLQAPPRPKREAVPGVHRGRAKGKGGGPAPAAKPKPAPPVPLPLQLTRCPGPPAPEPPPPSTETAGETAIILGPALPPARPERRQLGRVWVDGLNGAKLQYQDYRAPGSTTTYRNYIIRGPCSTGEVKSKTRGRTTEYQARHGEIEPIAFLQAWLLKATGATNARKKENDPSDDQVDVMVANHGQKLWELFRELVPQP